MRGKALGFIYPNQESVILRCVLPKFRVIVQLEGLSATAWGLESRPQPAYEGHEGFDVHI